jgi:predicted TIM-barrel fold metal-dependent hydrolase
MPTFGLPCRIGTEAKGKTMTDTEIDSNNVWRKETPGADGWPRTARPGDPKKYFMVSADCHANEPGDLWTTRMDPQYHERIPSFTFDENKRPNFQVTEGFRPIKIRDIKFEGEDAERNGAGRTPEERLADHDRDGVDAEIIFPNKGLAMWATPDAKFSQAMCHAWNDWAWETFGPYNDRLAPMACLATGDLEGAIEETKRCAKLGFRGISIPCKPVWGANDVAHSNYNLPEFDPFWAVVQDCDMPITIHVSTGRDPRTARGNGGAVINYAAHALAPTIEPVANLCASGVFERFPKLRFATIEAGIGWIPWALQAMDEAYKKHHMFTRPKLKMLPSEYFKEHGYASFQEDAAGIDLARKHELVDNFLWANDYPHHEGSWPHSASAIEREMGELTDTERAKILGLNAAKLWKFDVPREAI